MDSEDYEIDDIACPKCRAALHSRNCTALYCEDGEIDECNDDPINFTPGEEYLTCSECSGTGIERWCPECGWQWNGESLREFWIE